MAKANDAKLISAIVYFMSLNAKLWTHETRFLNLPHCGLKPPSILPFGKVMGGASGSGR